jgi:hypothetical protein
VRVSSIGRGINFDYHIYRIVVLPERNHEMQHGLGGIDLEFAIKARFEALGWQLETTSATADFGADLVARSGHEVLVVQCEDYGSPAGIAAVQEAYFVRVHYGASTAAVVARNGFTKAAIKGAATTGVQALRPNDVVAGISFDRTYRQAELERERKRAHETPERNEGEREQNTKWTKNPGYGEIPIRRIRVIRCDPIRDGLLASLSSRHF